ncbi:hypothetical protein GCM10010106_27130 [Thermopolyspora flexuosa]|jgi:hypothetical protein|uniref:Uncharacterized protein n=1 Tax=Thermopolyspora flexuosa TaxID=103836 RepID=A0A543IW52_9ACTN|nr:hypothetical protein [Thermopolyspora flexuosa]TQM74813.1 hypothetical protein FHX40_1497 [Thermopolyspora flexuosa]GGM79118.1 hypothetical protein GCM10010106_27130 [Thermopolyspora flexuosa]
MTLDIMSCLERFAQATRNHIDLSVRVKYATPAYVHVRNRFSERLTEDVTCNGNGEFVTSWGYRLGSVDDIEGAAARLAYLLAALPATR